MPRPRIYRTNAAKQAAYRRRKRKRHSVWATPPDLFASLDKEFRFDLDVCALPENAKCARYFTPKEDGLAQAWSGTVWMNPPYGPTCSRWVRKAFESAQQGATVVCLLPARTDTQWWHDHVLPHAELRYIRGRLKFNDAGDAPFPSVVAIFKAWGGPQ